ncbi:MAG: exo-alpha-sialidase, partial [Ignavibacteriaceae bacterium]|nr:exo-alpha-sialidase [Ignavibacteriaceae bacterium]
MKVYNWFIFISINIFLTTYAQIDTPTRFPVQEYFQNNYESCLLGLPNNDLIMFWYDSTYSQLKSAKSNDGGLNWQPENIVTSFITDEYGPDINATILNSGRILLTYRYTQYYIVYSDDNGISWSSPAFLPTRPNVPLRRRVYLSALAKLSNGDVGFTYGVSSSNNLNDAKGIFIIKSSDGINWSAADTIATIGKNGQLMNFENSKEIVVYQDSTSTNYDLFYRVSSDTGLTWSNEILLVGDYLSQTNPRIAKDQNGKTWLYYLQQEATPFDGIFQSNIKYIYSLDDGNIWSTPINFTKYVGPDENFNLSLWNGRPIITFASKRHINLSNSFFQIYFTSADLSIDTDVPPFMYKFLHSAENLGPNQPYIVQAFIDDDKTIVSVKLNTYTNPPPTYDVLEMYDDGLHYDSLAGDKIYGTAIIPNSFGDHIIYSFSIEDDDTNLVQLNGGTVSLPVMYATYSYLLDVNNFELPLNNKGILAAVQINGQQGGLFEESTILYSGGFFLSGLNNGTVWTNAVASASLVEDYLPGPVGSEPSDIYNKLYIIKNSDPPFGAAWQVYSQAVNLGADYYDGNNDGLYNPIDLNGNNTWDINEDRPDFLGDVTAWCTFNDAVPGTWRRYSDQQPMGIEIQQTVFAWGENVSDPIDNMIFIRYRILNTGTVSNKFDSVFFSAWSDPDLGDPSDDLVGSDVFLNSGYVYNNGPDGSYGSNPPALAIPILQGPAVYIPGETFLDMNSNGVYDNGIDVPLDSAYINNGPVIGTQVLPGAKNQDISSFIHYMGGDPILNDPNNAVEARTYLLGLTRLGIPVDPCNWSYGQVLGGVNCATIDPRFLYSGNPVSSVGWINSVPADHRMFVNTGPFTLELDKPIDIIVCYLIGRGSSALNSVTVMKSITEEAIQIYNSNFTDIPTSIENKP